MKFPFRYVLIVAAVAIIVALVNIRLEKTVSDDTIVLRTVELAGTTVHVAVVDTPIARERGLSGRQGLAGDEGMLFVFPKDGKYSFWMKDMLFSIDILWIAADGGIVDMVQNIAPDSYPSAFTPIAPARYVLELPAGYVKGHNVHVADIVRLE